MYELRIFFNDDGRPFIYNGLNKYEVARFKEKLTYGGRFIDFQHEGNLYVINKDNITCIKIEKIESEEDEG